MPLETENLIELTVDIVTAHISNNLVPVEGVVELIRNVFSALEVLGTAKETTLEKRKGAISVRASIKPGHIISMIDGKPYKMLKRHLSLHGYTPESYRQEFDLPRDYPMVASDYAQKRRILALQIGLGRNGKVEAKPVRKPRAKKAAKASTNF